MAAGMIHMIPTTSPQGRFFHNFYFPEDACKGMSQQQGSTSMFSNFLAAELGKCELDELITHSAFAKMVEAEFRAYDLGAPGELSKRQTAIAKEIQQKIQQQIEKLDSEEKELESREEKRKHVRAQRERLEQALQR